MRRLLAGGILCIAILTARAEQTGPWNMAALSNVPAATWGEAKEQIQEVYYAGENYKGKPTRVFAYYGKPEGAGPFPGIILVHGGGGTAFRNWVKHWVKNGYAALAMDLAGKGPTGRLPDGGPDQGDNVKFPVFGPDEVKDVWTYQAVAAVIRGHSLLASLKEVDPKRTALTGISWGGYLTCIVVGLDHRFKAAVPVYGCGFIHEKSAWVDNHFSKMPDDLKKRWIENFEPSRYLGQAQCPMMFMNGTSDFAYPLESYQKSYKLVKSPVTLCIQINRGHGHIWSFPEVDAFINSTLKKGEPLLKIGPMNVAGEKASAVITNTGTGTVAKAQLDYAVGPNREWKSLPAEIKGKTVSANLPAERPLICYFYVMDQRGLAISNPHIELNTPIQAEEFNAPLTMASPLSCQVFQRSKGDTADILVEGTVSDKADVIEAKADLVPGAKRGTSIKWTAIASQSQIVQGKFSGRLKLKAGGWYQVTIRARAGVKVIAQQGVDKVGVGEVFVTAGQSNSANYGKPHQKAQDDRVVYFNGKGFVSAQDPIPGGCGGGGSPWALLGDRIAASQQVPVCFRSASLNWTEIAAWLPPNTDLYKNLQACVKVFGKDGVRAVLWHQGESDTLVKTSAETYCDRMKTIVETLNKDAGYSLPWLVAQASFHPGSKAPEQEWVTQGQQLTWSKKICFQGPITDDLLGAEYRHDGVHFNQKGLETHATRWFDALSKAFTWKAKQI